MNYNSIESIFESGVTNMTPYKTESESYDKQFRYSTHVSWWKYKGYTVSYLYFGSDSYLSTIKTYTSYMLRYNYSELQRISKCFYYEVGTLWNTYNFVKFRWSGYSAYGTYGTASYEMTYDLLVFDTLDMCLYCANNGANVRTNGDYSFKAMQGASSVTYTYTAPTKTNPYVTFYHKDNYGYDFDIDYNIIALEKPFKYLIGSEDSYYTIADDILTKLDITELTSSVFKENGFDFIEDLSIIKELVSPKIYCWCLKGLQTIKATVTATPLPQEIEMNNSDLSKDSTITAISKMESTYSGSPTSAVSIDEGETWKYFDGETWTDVTEETVGMSMDILQSLTSDNWNDLLGEIKEFKYKFRISDEDTVTNIVFTYSHEEA